MKNLTKLLTAGFMTAAALTGCEKTEFAEPKEKEDKGIDLTKEEVIEKIGGNSYASTVMDTCKFGEGGRIYISEDGSQIKKANFYNDKDTKAIIPKDVQTFNNPTYNLDEGKIELEGGKEIDLTACNKNIEQTLKINDTCYSFRPEPLNLTSEKINGNYELTKNGEQGYDVVNVRREGNNLVIREQDKGWLDSKIPYDNNGTWQPKTESKGQTLYINPQGVDLYVENTEQIKRIDLEQINPKQKDNEKITTAYELRRLK